MTPCPPPQKQLEKKTVSSHLDDVANTSINNPGRLVPAPRHRGKSTGLGVRILAVGKLFHLFIKH